jgi:hypothetical protein
MPLDCMTCLRFFTKAEVVTNYSIRPDFENEFFEECPVAFHSGGQPFFKESDVDEYLRWFRSPPYVHPSRRRGGKLSDQDHVAELADKLQRKGNSWKEVAAELNKQCPPSAGKRKPDAVRKLVSRYRTRHM